MQDDPSVQELIGSVVAFLRLRAMPALPPHAAFEARVSANALELVQREMALGPSAAAAEYGRLAALLSIDATLPDLNACLASGLANGSINVTDPSVMDHLWATTLEKLAVDQPGYPAYRRALGPDGNANREVGHGFHAPT